MSQHLEHDGHWECLVRDAAQELYEAGVAIEHIFGSRELAVDEYFAMWKLRQALAKATGCRSDGPANIPAESVG